MTAAGNHVIPNVHFRKVNGMQKGYMNRAYIKPWLAQAARKKRRGMNRKAKAAKVAPRPAAGLLRPVVHPPTQRYNMKLRLGRGFTLAELREARIAPKLARTIGICVDHRRRNRSTESLQENVSRLKEYKTKLLVFPRGSGKKCVKKGDTARSELANVAQNTLKAIIPVPKPSLRVKSRAITQEEKDFCAYAKVKKARSDLKYWGAKKKNAMEKSEKEAMK